MRAVAPKEKKKKIKLYALANIQDWPNDEQVFMNYWILARSPFKLQLTGHVSKRKKGAKTKTHSTTTLQQETNTSQTLYRLQRHRPLQITVGYSLQ
jgi:hypothetical protein